MLHHRPSITAFTTALRRAAHQVFDDPVVFDDPLALRIVGNDGMARIQKDPTIRQPIGIELRATVVARSKYAQECLQNAFDRGVRQCVILGAGLDTTAYREPALRMDRVIEVDFPATQLAKQRCLGQGNIPAPANLVFLPINFERQSLASELKAAGLNFTRPAFFMWLGDVPFQTEETVFDTLQVVASAAPGSEIVFDYADRPETLDFMLRQMFDRMAQRVAELGSPWVTFLDPEDLRNRLTAVGFSQIEDLGGSAINGRYFSGRKDGLGIKGLARVARATV